MLRMKKTWAETIAKQGDPLGLALLELGTVSTVGDVEYVSVASRDELSKSPRWLASNPPGTKKQCKQCASKGAARKLADGAAGLLKHLGQRAGVALDVASVEQAHARLGVCMQCEHRKENNCDKCGCIIVAKVAQAKQTCPEGKW